MTTSSLKHRVKSTTYPVHTSSHYTLCLMMGAHIHLQIIALGFVCLFSISTTSAFSVQNAASSKSGILQDKLTEQLDGSGKYILSWTINEETKEITFEIDAETVGYVGLGISPTGKMTGADIFIAGVDQNGEIYSGDYYATDNARPLPDDHNDWNLEEARENGTHTYIRVTRLLDTCDQQDYAITDANTARVIYALGDSDVIAYHRENKGTKSINLIELPLPDVDVEADGIHKWNVVPVEMEMPATDTTYWCTIHKAPPITKKHHVIGFDVFLDGDVALKHSHHFIVTKCVTPPGADADAIFEHLVGHVGEDCNARKVIPANYCRKYLFVWAVGGKRMLFPLDVGFPIGESNENAYYMLEAHYDNPGFLEGKRFRSGLEIYYTDKLRDIDAELLEIGHDTGENLLVPPNQTGFEISGHCTSTCSNLFPEGGLNVFNILLHSHLSGRKLKLRHFRDGAELPWLAYDDTYDFDFQQNKPLRHEVTILQGDHLTYECVYDSTWNNGKVVLGGLSSREEMCLAFLWVYSRSTKTSFDFCGSVYSYLTMMSEFGIGNLTWDDNNKAVITEPEEFNGVLLEDYLSWNISWTPDLVQAQQQKQRYGIHDTFCIERSGGFVEVHEGKYPEFEEYIPDDLCNADNPSISTTAEPEPTTESSATMVATIQLGAILSTVFVVLLNL